MNNLLIFCVLLIVNCSVTYATKYQYWENLNDSLKSSFIHSTNIGDNLKNLYNHQIYLTDDDASRAILDTLCTQVDGNKRMFYFHMLNDVVMHADGALAEMLAEYCFKYVSENSDYVLYYFSLHSDISEKYALLIAAELYYKDISYTDYLKELTSSVKDDMTKNYLPLFIKKIEINMKHIQD